MKSKKTNKKNKPKKQKQSSSKNSKKNIYLWTGTGWGKTTSALGVALRAIGHGYKVIIIQFMKGRKNIGEYKIRKKFNSKYKIYQFGKKQFVNLKNPGKKDKQRAQEALEFAKKAVKEKPKLLVLDEINLAAAIKLINVNEVLDLLDKAPKSTNVYLTGRYAPKKLINRADYVTKITEVKHPGISKKAKKGIDY